MEKPLNVLVLQGGGALGAYQAGAFESMLAHGEQVDWVCGVSIGAINAAIIAGNLPHLRLEKLRQFWSMITVNVPFPVPQRGNPMRQLWNEASAASVAFSGIPGFFVPRPFPPWPAAVNSPSDASFYDTRQLRDTLGELIDFNILNTGPVRLSVGAVNVKTGNSIYFDTRTDRIGPEHIMASGALPPGFPAIEIDGHHYWDGGLVSNAPLEYVIDSHRDGKALTVFQIDLFSARGTVPRSLIEIEARQKEIRFSSRTRFNTDRARELHNMRVALCELRKKIPAELADDPLIRRLQQEPEPGPVSVLHLIYRRADYETGSRDYEFSKASMEEHWQAGLQDAAASLADARWQQRHAPTSGFATFDFRSEEGQKR